MGSIAIPGSEGHHSLNRIVYGQHHTLQQCKQPVIRHRRHQLLLVARGETRKQRNNEYVFRGKLKICVSCARKYVRKGPLYNEVKETVRFSAIGAQCTAWKGSKFLKCDNFVLGGPIEVFFFFKLHNFSRRMQWSSSKGAWGAF